MSEAQDRSRAAEQSRSSSRAPLSELRSFCSGMEAGWLGVWSWDLRSHRLAWSSNLPSLHGPPKGQLEGDFALAPHELPAQEGASLLAAMHEVLRTSKPCRVEYRVHGPAGRDERWIEVATTVVMADGSPLHMLGTCRDVTERLRVNREVTVRARQQETLARLGEQALTESDLQKFFNEVVETVGDILDAEMIAILELLPGDSELLLRAGVGWKAGLTGTATVSTGRASQAGYTLASGRPVVVDNLKEETRFSGQLLLDEHGVVSGITAPIAGRDGRAYGVLGAHTPERRKFQDYEVSFTGAVANVVAGAIQRRQLDQRHELMIRELRHRSGNLFSQLLALFSQTAKNSSSIEDLVTKYEARVLALANAHRLITEGGWKSTSLYELLNSLLAPFLDRISFNGPNVFLEPDPTFGLSMAVHELLTNASKHGSLISPTGRVDLTWSIARTEQGLTLILEWKESGGPAPKRMRPAGFGSRLITMVIERQLNGHAKQKFGPEGLDVVLTVPLTHQRWPGAARTGGQETSAP